MSERTADNSQEIARARFEREQMRKSINTLRVLVVVELVLLVGFSYGMWDTGRRIQQTTNEVNGLRENIQNLFSSNVPLVERLNGALTEANQSAEQLNSSLAGDGGVNAQMDEAMERMKTEMPKTFEAFFERKGPDLMKGALNDPRFQDDARDQVSEIIKEAMNDPSVQEEMAQSMREALRSGLSKKQ